MLMAAQYQVDSGVQARSQRVACIKDNDLVGAGVRNSYQVVMHRHYLWLALSQFGEALFHPQVLSVADLALLPIGPGGAQREDYGVVTLVDLRCCKELLEQ